MTDLRIAISVNPEHLRRLIDAAMGCVDAFEVFINVAREIHSQVTLKTEE